MDLEVIDKTGCKASVVKSVNIKKGVKADFSATTDNGACTYTDLCIKNISSTGGGTVKSHYWEIDSLTSAKDHRANPYCVRYTKSKPTVWVKLVVEMTSGCKDSAKRAYKVEVDRTLHTLTLSNSKPCYSERAIRAYVNKAANESVRWIVNGKYLSDTVSSVRISFDRLYLDTGKHKVQCIVRKGSCTRSYTKEFTIKGPKSNPSIFNGTQCGPLRKVFMVADVDSGHNPNYEYKWFVSDPDGEKCVINREKNINKYKNCNTTEGWFGKHQFSAYQYYTIRLEVKDSESGCTDSKVASVNINACGNCAGIANGLVACQGAWFMAPKRTHGDPMKFSLDSGKTWMTYPSKLPSHLTGYQDVSLIFNHNPSVWVEDYGDDSIRINKVGVKRSDTLHFENALYIEPAKTDVFSMQLSAQCNPTSGWLKIKSGKFKAGEKLYIRWGDGYASYYHFTKDTTLNLLEHEYRKPGLNDTVRITTYSKSNCEMEYKVPIRYGFKHQLQGRLVQCAGEDACMSMPVTDYASGTPWNPDGSDGEVKWYMEGKQLGPAGFQFCHRFDSAGLYNLYAVATSKRGCSDTSRFQLYISKVEAGVKKASRLHYCKGQMQFSDSSTVIFPSRDPIRYYNWDLGRGFYNSTLKNPAYSFDGDQKEVIIRHLVETKYGCKDEITYKIRVLKSSPRLSIADSIGCADFTIDLKNTSTGATHFIWEMGDDDKNTIQTTDSSGVQFTYTKPGRYFINLIGIDSFHNPVNQQVYYCFTSYPGPSDKPVSVVVLPNQHAGLLGPDKLCVNQGGTFTSQSGAGYTYDRWKIDGSSQTYPAGRTRTLSFSDSGWHTIELRPYFYGHAVVPACVSEIKKEVYVEQVVADFIVDPVSVEPKFHFLNKSVPSHASYKWDFGHPKSGADNFSTLKDPWHNYGRDNGQFQVCLEASLSAVCKDRTCTTLSNYFNEEIEIYNVFTPNDDGNNDSYELTLEGEDFHELLIYNRWGELVYESKSDQDQLETILWNGRVFNKGADCPEGSYFYVLKYAFSAEPDEVFDVSGVITLIRD